MHRLLSLKQASAFTSSSSLLRSLPYKSVSSIAKPIPQYHFIRSASLRQWPSKPSFTGEIQGFSYPVYPKRFWLNFSTTHQKVSSRSLLYSRVQFLKPQIPKGRLGFGPTFALLKNRWRSWFQRFSASDMILGLVLTNVAVFLLWRIADRRFMMDNFMVSLDNFISGRLHTLITSAFSHIDLEHIVSNMIGLYFFGYNIARTFGPEYLLKLYLAGAIGGSIFYLVHHALLAKGQGTWMDPSRTPGLGASGAVNAIMLLDIFLNPKATLYFDFIIPVPAMLLGIFLIGKDILRITEGNSHISGSAHLGGAAVAAIAWAQLRRRRF
ncbi:Detected protein of confused Function [Hibiscus syriacus]|uniref:Detected protein of confused Function n=1 Tax=Hibiscus syriacus TaxID=106335 RepID=A0A6A3D6S6_HIBSY|nr:RHOMBOID-like protein 12, mitochondrial [Hibiscus syriacus]KAE8734949.1 Detected protein of confused Function [Hibiscus syriacus]